MLADPAPIYFAKFVLQYFAGSYPTMAMFPKKKEK